MYDTWLVGGIDLTDTGLVRFITDLSGGFDAPALRGSLPVVVGRDGEIHVDQAIEASTLTLGLGIVADTIPEVNDAIRAVKLLGPPGEEVTITRRQSFTGGNEEHTARAEYLTHEIALDLEHLSAKMAFSWRLLDGLWYGDLETISTGAVSVLGDVRTHRMTITLAGSGTNPTLTNSRTGHSLTFTGSTATAVEIDVEAMTAMQGATDVSADLTWTKSLPFRLAPGAQTLACSSGTASIEYAPAYQ